MSDDIRTDILRELARALPKETPDRIAAFYDLALRYIAKNDTLRKRTDLLPPKDDAKSRLENVERAAANLRKVLNRLTTDDRNRLLRAIDRDSILPISDNDLSCLVKAASQARGGNSQRGRKVDVLDRRDVEMLVRAWNDADIGYEVSWKDGSAFHEVSTLILGDRPGRRDAIKDAADDNLLSGMPPRGCKK